MPRGSVSVFAVSALVLAFLAGLGMGAIEEPRPIAMLAAVVPPPAPARAAPRPPGVRPLVVALPVDAGSLDPSVQLTTGHALSIVNHLFEPLARPDHKKGGLEPVLATAWRNLNPTTWEIKLRQG